MEENFFCRAHTYTHTILFIINSFIYLFFILYFFLLRNILVILNFYISSSPKNINYFNTTRLLVWNQFDLFSFLAHRIVFWIVKSEGPGFFSGKPTHQRLWSEEWIIVCNVVISSILPIDRIGPGFQSNPIYSSIHPSILALMTLPQKLNILSIVNAVPYFRSLWFNRIFFFLVHHLNGLSNSCLLHPFPALFDSSIVYLTRNLFPRLHTLFTPSPLLFYLFIFIFRFRSVLFSRLVLVVNWHPEMLFSFHIFREKKSKE